MSNHASAFNNVYVARHPVLDGDGEIWGYELLFRDGADAVRAVISNEDTASTCVAAVGFIRARERQASDKKIVITFTEKLILERAPRALPAEITVIRLPASIAASQPLIEALRELRKDGYLVSAHAVPELPMNNALLALADIIEVNTKRDDMLAALELAKGSGAPGRLIQAARVETPELREFFQAAGCQLFKGYFYARPEQLAGRTIVSAQQPRLALLSRTEDPNLSIADFSELIKPDPSLAYRLLRFLNSAAFDFLREITSIEQAISLLGLDKFRHWLRLIIVSDMNSSPIGPEFTTMAYSRALLFQEIGPQRLGLAHAGDKLFLFGLFSLLGVMLEVPLEDVLSYLPLSQEIKDGYFAQQSPYHHYLQLAEALEQGDWDEVDYLCADMGLDNDDTALAYNSALSAAIRLMEVA